MSDKIAEFIRSDDGGVTLAVRPALSFSAEGFRLDGGQVVVFGETRKLPFLATEEERTALEASGGLLLVEFLPDGEERETDLILDSL